MDKQEKFYNKKWFTILILILFTPVGIILMWKNNQWTKKTRIILSIIFGVYFIIMFIYSQPTEEEKAEEKAQQEQQEKEELKKLKDERKQEEKDRKKDEKELKEVEKAKEEVEKEKKELEEELEKEKNKQKNKEKETNDKKSEKSNVEKELKGKMEKVSLSELISFKGSFDKEPYTIQVVLRGKENLTQGMTTDGMKNAVLDAVYSIKETGYDIENLNISVKYPLVDQYGNEEDKYVIKSSFSGKTIDKLADDRFKINIDNLNNIADDWWEHSVLSN